MDGDTTAAAPQAAPETPQAASAPQATDGAPAPQEGQQPQQPDRMAAIAAKYARTERELKRAQKLMAERDQELASLKQFQERFQRDPFGLLEEAGVTYDKWTARVLQGKGKQEEDPVSKLQAKLDAVEAKLAEREQAETQTVQQREEQQLREEMAKAVASTPELAFTACLGASDLVLAEIRKHQKEYGDCPPAEQMRIARGIEAQNRATVKQQLSALAKVDGFKAMLQEALGDGPSPSEPEAGQPARQGQAAAAPKPKPKTLTNSQAAEVGARGGGSRSDADRVRAALERLSG